MTSEHPQNIENKIKENNLLKNVWENFFFEITRLKIIKKNINNMMKKYLFRIV